MTQTRRTLPFLGVLAAAGLTLLSGCMSSGPVGDTVGQNGSGASYLASIRSSNGLPALSPDSTLEAAALEQTRLMSGAQRMNHTARFGKNFGRRARGSGIEGAAAENIAYGAFGMDELFQRWMNSPGHRRNMLNPAYTRYGLASASDATGKRYWALILAD
ncbi:MAG: CAP domain-containing protein [Rhizobiaceae bacterium]